ncbi:DNA-directed RNA polymerase subunit beta [Lapidilactobacillus mulanensis]|uniref:DNA-directed RNA polymerase subunit beta n=1 Tax=Lapidilactobacillus mulanensis TaxID=2485999 RepID=A0ABW4DLG8_9LACO|nr:DNA-directed RNA polymerase subunit beta [Lapidilactobacillus mulanensis]
MKFKMDSAFAGSAFKKIGWLIVAFLLAILIGAVIGYGISGKGDPLTVFSPQTWEHILDFLR